MTVSDETDHTFSFQYIFRSDKLNEPLFITGNTIRQNDGYRTLNAAVGVEKPEQTVLSIRLNSETLNRPISVSDKTIFDPESDKDNPAVYLSAATNAVIFASEILPILPQDYQQLVLNLIYPN